MMSMTDRDSAAGAHESDPLLLDVDTVTSVIEIPSGTTEAAANHHHHHHHRQSSLNTIVEKLEFLVEGTREFTQDIVDTVHESAVVARELTNDLVETVQDSVSDVKEAITDEVHEVKDAFFEELHEAEEQEDKSFLLEMQLTRNMGLLPQDAVDASELVSDIEFVVETPHDSPPSPSELDLEKTPLLLGKKQEQASATRTEGTVTDHATTNTTKPPTPWHAYFLLASAVIALASIGPLLKLQENVGATMKVYWRTSATSFLLFPFASYSIYQQGFPKLSQSQWCKLFFAAGSYAALCVFFVWALNYTTVGNTVILGNAQALILLVGKIFVGEPVSNLEGIGAVVAFVGAILCSKDSSESTNGSSEEDKGHQRGAMMALLGDLFAIASAVAVVAYLVLAKTVRSAMDIYVFMFFVMFVGSLQTLLFILMAGEPLTFDANYSTGIFGWIHLDADRLPLEIAMAVVCNFFGAMGYVRSMHYFDNLVISVAALMEPVVAEFLGCLLNVGTLPGWQGWLGNALVALGTLAVVYQPASGGGKISSSGH